MNNFSKPVVDTLADLAESHLQAMSGVPWASYAEGIAERAAQGRPAGDTFGCTIDGRYYDVGDSQMWVNEEGGDIRLVSFATTYASDEDDEGQTVERETIIPRC